MSNPPNYYDSPPSNAWKISAVDSVGLCLAFAVVVIRYYTKYSVTKILGWEDRKPRPAWYVRKSVLLTPRGRLLRSRLGVLYRSHNL